LTPKLVAIFAHPDDESFSAGGTLARYVDYGVDVTLVTATRGEAGEIRQGIPPPEDVGQLREAELRTALSLLGVEHLRLLGLPDGKLDTCEHQLQSELYELLGELKPQVVITEDVRGITGHPDHIEVTKAVVKTFDRVAEVMKLYEHVVPGGGPTGHLLGTPEDHITTWIDVEPWRERMLEGLQAHRSQVPPDTVRRFHDLPKPLTDHYVCVRTRVPILIPERDLFAGID